jgi:hypothetical protein
MQKQPGIRQTASAPSSVKFILQNRANSQEAFE